MSFAHLTLATQDVEKTAAFFERTIGWKRVPIAANTPIKAVWMEVGPGQQVHILNIEGFEVSKFEAEFGRHLAMFHPGADFPDLRNRLVAQGAELFDPIRPTPFERFFFKDPNGYLFEVIAQEQYVVE